MLSTMFFRLLYNPKCILSKHRLQLMLLSTKTADNALHRSESLEKWQITGAVCITRPPIICPPLTPLEEKFSEMISRLEKENSVQNDHELRIEQDRIRAELLKSGDLESTDIEEAALQTALEYEDACIEELKLTATTFAPKVTEADKMGSLDTLDRALHRSLVLVVKQKLGENHQWIFPQSPWNPGETLRQSCERVVREKCGLNLKVKFLGNAPSGFYKYRFPKNTLIDGCIGAKVFFYKCQVRGVTGDVQPGDDIAAYEWRTLDELDERLKKQYAKSVSQFLVSDQ
ncbi:39S ribosomal protein L46, mitochondrial [Halocaridina rubra]|uniref:Large ribosomal subunit protein mL46 n=1 Tax=Halocaridina rubra TaxID=373956 RepID=A0AAN8XIZ0_HALRR